MVAASASIPDTSSFTMMEFDQQSKGKMKVRRGTPSRAESFGIGDFPDFPNRARGLSDDSFAFNFNGGDDDDDESDGADNENKIPSASSASSSSSSSKNMMSFVPGDDGEHDGDSPFNDSFGTAAFARIETKELFETPPPDDAPVRRPPGRTASENSAFSIDSCFQDSGFDDFSSDDEEGNDDAEGEDEGEGEVGPSRIESMPSGFRDIAIAPPRRNANSQLGQKRIQMRTGGPADATTTSKGSGMSTFEEQLKKLGSDDSGTEVQTELDCMSKAVSALTEPSFGSSTGSSASGTAAPSSFNFDKEWNSAPTTTSSPLAFGSPPSLSSRRCSIGVFRINNMNQSARALGTNMNMPSKEDHQDMFSSWQSRSTRTLGSHSRTMPAKTDRGMLSGWQSSRTLDTQSTVAADFYGYGDVTASSPYHSPNGKVSGGSDGFKSPVKAKRSNSIDHVAKSGGNMFYTPKLGGAAQGRRRMSVSTMSAPHPPLPPSGARPNHHNIPPPPPPLPSGAKMGSMTPGRSGRRSSIGFVPKTPQPTSAGSLCLAPNLNGATPGIRPRRMSFNANAQVAPPSSSQQRDMSSSCHSVATFSGSASAAGRPPRGMGMASSSAAAKGVKSKVGQQQYRGSSPPLPPSSAAPASPMSQSPKTKIRVKVCAVKGTSATQDMDSDEVKRLVKGHLDKTLKAPTTETTDSHFGETFHSCAASNDSNSYNDDETVVSRWEDKSVADCASVSGSVRHINKRREQLLAQEEAMDAGTIDVQDPSSLSSSKNDKGAMTEEERKAAKAATKAKKEAKKKKAKKDDKKKKKKKKDKDKKPKKKKLSRSKSSKSLGGSADGYDSDGTFTSYVTSTADKTNGEDDDDNSENSEGSCATYETSTERYDDDMSDTATEGDLGKSIADLKIKDLIEIEKSLDKSVEDDEKSNDWLENYNPEEISVIGDVHEDQTAATVSAKDKSDRRKNKKKHKSKKSLFDGFESDGSTKKSSKKKKSDGDGDDKKKKKKSKSKKSTDPDGEQSLSSLKHKSKKKSKKLSSKSKKSKSKEGGDVCETECRDGEFCDEDEATAAITTVDSVEGESDNGIDASLDDECNSMYMGLPVDDYGYEASSKTCAV